ncbi:acyl-CoA ligase (AMP-forming), exosortase A system-associated [Paraburkholderia phosphatilytica]|uniref:acyl-CoA ligase (AMP-forming), exosortase A system-associated n=1 Tax=Paraburkholderia phosphatilytica TaxID=2282883 RepID=UPI000E50CBEA|nr:acyl-CoA ligase (AMP-forming), exosortase A system-associated [Paraburkholderia phosphatilytica]
MRNILDLVETVARHSPHATALISGRTRITYAGLSCHARAFGEALAGYGISPGERVAIFLDKRVETVVALLGSAAAGCVSVPVNALLRPRQVAHILRDCGARCLVTTRERARILESEASLVVPAVMAVDPPDGSHSSPSMQPACAATLYPWPAPTRTGAADEPSRLPAAAAGGIDTDLAAILYTSGSTGLPKGVMVTHRNLLEGAWSVAHYLQHTAADRILAVLPLSFDAGLSQLTSAWAAGATPILLNYLTPGDVTTTCEHEGVTAITGVPPLWMQLARADWPDTARRQIRYFANTGGHLPLAVLGRLREIFPQAAPCLMYGLTEAFRSTFLEPAEIDRRPGSIGKAVPNARVLVVHEDGTPCAPGETGELVHTGAFVTPGYWNDPAHTALRYRPSPEPGPGGTSPAQAVWSGDLVRRDAEGFLYFVARQDAQIKTSGYRVSPEEVEETVHASGLVSEAVAIGTPDEALGEVITLLLTPASPESFDPQALRSWCAHHMPPYMVPAHFVVCARLPRNPNGKFDRSALRAMLRERPTASGEARP